MKLLTDEEIKKLYEADEYYFDALETNDLDKQEELLEKCLALNPDHLDANILMIINNLPPYFAVSRLQELERAEKRKLKKKTYMNLEGCMEFSKQDLICVVYCI